jgi:hypothetical protein
LWFIAHSHPPSFGLRIFRHLATTLLTFFLSFLSRSMVLFRYFLSFHFCFRLYYFHQDMSG